MQICIALYNFVWHCRGACMYTLETSWFLTYTYMTQFRQISWLYLGGCVHKLFPFLQIFMTHVGPKLKFSNQILWNLIYFKVYNLESFLLKFSHNTDNDDREVLKTWKFKTLQTLTPHEKFPIFPDFTNFRPKFHAVYSYHLQLTLSISNILYLKPLSISN